jgi:hypothetical protein
MIDRGATGSRKNPEKEEPDSVRNQIEKATDNS